MSNENDDYPDETIIELMDAIKRLEEELAATREELAALRKDGMGW